MVNTLILSAGQGRRLLPLTATLPKCLLPVAGRSVIEWQMRQLAACGIRRSTVVVGFGADKVRRVLADSLALPMEIRTINNPHFKASDNLVSCWIARGMMDDDFVLLNGDTLFEPEVLERLLASRRAPITMVISRKREYDADDMKVHCDGSMLLAVGKDLPPEATDGESIGMLLFRGDGPRIFREALDEAVRREGSVRQWYLSVVNEIAARGLVRTVSVDPRQWTEIDFPSDLQKAEALVSGWELAEEKMVLSAPAVMQG